MGSYAAQARFDGCIAFTTWRRVDVERLLPAELTLVGTGDEHAVAFVFGRQRDAAVLFGGFMLPSVGRYLELCVAVPSVRPRSGGDVHIFISRMYASYFPAVWNGNTYFGFAKESARLDWDGATFAVRDDDDRALVRAETRPTGAWMPARAESHARFAEMRAVFAQPVLGRTHDGRWMRSAFGWDFADALIRPMEARISGPDVGSCRSAGGAFEVREMLWRVGWPSLYRI